MIPKNSNHSGNLNEPVNLQLTKLTPVNLQLTLLSSFLHEKPTETESAGFMTSFV